MKKPNTLTLKIFILFVAFTAFFTEAGEPSDNNCTNKDNRKPPLVNHIRDQADMGWCYAYVAADLISHNLGVLVSAVDVANTYNSSSKWHADRFRRGLVDTPIKTGKESDRRAGNLRTSIDLAIKKGVCLEENVKSSGFSFERDSSLRAELRKFEDLKAQYDRQVATNASGGCVGNCSSIENFDGGFKEIFNVDDQQILEVFEKTTKPNDIINQIITESCKDKRIKIENINIVYKWYKQRISILDQSESILDRIIGASISDKHLLRNINTQLDVGNIIGISYYLDDELLSNFPSGQSLVHASSIVARKFDEKSNTCKYLLRNSFGEICDIYQEKHECEKGQVWVPAKYLSKHWVSITYIE